jgi:hypothetical protein
LLLLVVLSRVLAPLARLLQWLVVPGHEDLDILLVFIGG